MGPAITMTLLILGMDYSADRFLIISLVTALITQIPKRFAFRKRPYMVGRAFKLRNSSKTSSFPSKAVICAVVFGYGLFETYNYEYAVATKLPPQTISEISALLIVISLALSASWARIYIGAHYPSDCIVGALVGVFIILITRCLNSMPHIFGCPSCYERACYPISSAQQMSNLNFSMQNVELISFISAVGFGLFFLLILPPIKFWEKAAPLFGSFFAIIVASVAIKCPMKGALGMKYVPIGDISTQKIFLAIVLGQSNLLSSLFAVKRYRALKNKSFLKHIVFNAGVFLLFLAIFTFVIIRGRLLVQF